MVLLAAAECALAAAQFLLATQVPDGERSAHAPACSGLFVGDVTDKRPRPGLSSRAFVELRLCKKPSEVFIVLC